MEVVEHPCQAITVSSVRAKSFTSGGKNHRRREKANSVAYGPAADPRLTNRLPAAMMNRPREGPSFEFDIDRSPGYTPWTVPVTTDEWVFTEYENPGGTTQPQSEEVCDEVYRSSLRLVDPPAEVARTGETVLHHPQVSGEAPVVVADGALIPYRRRSETAGAELYHPSSIAGWSQAPP